MCERRGVDGITERVKYPEPLRKRRICVAFSDTVGLDLYLSRGRLGCDYPEVG